MQYNKTADGKFEPMQRKNVDTGMGLERTLCILQGKESVYETDLFVPIVSKIEALSGKKYGANEADTRAMRIVADHVRTAVFMIGDEKGITCSNVDQGYILRRLLRRAIRFIKQLGMQQGDIAQVAAAVIERYKAAYPEIGRAHV